MNLRVFVYLSLSSLLFFSCRKTYTCECYTTVVFEYVTSTGIRYFASGVIPGGKTPYNQKLTEKKARAACMHEEEVLESSLINYFTNNGRSPLIPGESISTSCGLK